MHLETLSHEPHMNNFNACEMLLQWRRNYQSQVHNSGGAERLAHDAVPLHNDTSQIDAAECQRIVEGAVARARDLLTQAHFSFTKIEDLYGSKDASFRGFRQI